MIAIGFSLLMRVALMSTFNLANSNTVRYVRNVPIYKDFTKSVAAMLVKMEGLVRRNEKWRFYS